MHNNSIPLSPQEVVNLTNNPVSEELVAAAIVGVIRVAQTNGQSLSDLRSELLKDDSLLDRAQRRWLSDLVTHAWDLLVQAPDNSAASSPGLSSSR